MDMDLDIYDDLDDFHEEEKKKTNELVEWETKYNDALQTIEDLRKENKEQAKTIKRIEINFQSLLDTAKTEIQRKDLQIATIRKEKDDICFRRRQRSDNNSSKGIFKTSSRHSDVDVEPTYSEYSKRHSDKSELKRESTRSQSRKSPDPGSEKHARGSAYSPKRGASGRSYYQKDRDTSNQREKHYAKNTKSHSSRDRKDKSKDMHKKSTRRDSRRESSSRRDRSRESRRKKDMDVDMNIDNLEQMKNNKCDERHRHVDKDEWSYGKNYKKRSDDECSSNGGARHCFNDSNSMYEHRKRKRLHSSTPSEERKKRSSSNDMAKCNDYIDRCDNYDGKREKSRVKDTHVHAQMLDDEQTLPNTKCTDADYNERVESNCQPLQVAAISEPATNDLCCDQNKDTDENFNITDMSTPKKVQLFNAIFETHTANGTENGDGTSVMLTNIRHILYNTNQMEATSSVVTASAETTPNEISKPTKPQSNPFRKESGVSDSTSVMPPAMEACPEDQDKSVDAVMDVVHSNNRTSRKYSHDQTSTSDSVEKKLDMEINADIPILQRIMCDDEETITFNDAASTCTTTTRKQRIQILEDIRLPSVFDVGTHELNDATATPTATTNVPTVTSSATCVQYEKQSENLMTCTTECDTQLEAIATDDAIKMHAEFEEKPIAASCDVQEERQGISTLQLNVDENKKLVETTTANTTTIVNAPIATAKTLNSKTKSQVRKRKVIIRPEVTAAPCVINADEQFEKMLKPSTETLITSASTIESNEKLSPRINDQLNQNQITQSPARHCGRRRKRQDNQGTQPSSHIADDRAVANGISTHALAVSSPRPAMNSSYDDKLNELDLRLQSMFESPPRASDSATKQSHEVPTASVHQTNHIDNTTAATAAESTMNEVVNKSHKSIESEQSTVSDESTLNRSQPETKRISLGCSDYRVEKVSENVVNVFITRKHARRKILKKKLQEVVATANTTTRTPLT